jgi:glycosyltransferase involved in cell wall biosynthesis
VLDRLPANNSLARLTGQKMRIIHWYPNYLAGGAIAETILHLANGQAHLGHHVLVASQDFVGDPSYNPQIRESLQTDLHVWQPTMTLKLGNLPARLVPLTSLRKLRRFRADILHIHNGIFLEDALIHLALPSARTVLSPHGAFYPQMMTRRMRLYVGALRPLFYNRVSAFHALSPHEAIAIGKAFPRKRIYVAANGLSLNVDRGRPPASGRDDLKTWVRLICVGRLDINPKGLDILLRAFASAMTESPRPLELVLIGPPWGSDYPRLLELIDELRIGERVTIAGPTDRAGVVEALQAADIYVQLSRWDAFSLSAIEAMALGLPCILSGRIGAVSYSDVESLPHVHIAEPQADRVSDAIVRVVRSLAEQREAARRSASMIRERFSWRRATDSHGEAYHKLTAARRQE